MALLNAIEKRRAFRALSEKQVGRDILTRLAEAAHAAPSFSNSQPWRIITVVDPERLEALKAALSAGNYWAKKAPAIAAFVTDLAWDGRLDEGRDYALFDLGMAAMAYQLQAVEEGLITHPIAGFNAAQSKRALGIPESAVLETLVIVGFPGDASELNEKHREIEKSARSRKPLEEIAAFDYWSDRLVPALKK